MKKARVIEEHKTNYIIKDDGAEYTATVRGSFFEDGTFPKVGDYVSYSVVANDKAVIEELLPRHSFIARKAVGIGGAQVVVANVDVIFIVMGLDGDYNPSRLERYLLLAHQSDIAPVVVLNKCDGVDEVSRYLDEIRAIVGDVPVHAVSALTGENMDVLRVHVKDGATGVLLGSSGAGKSTITNWLLHTDAQPVRDVREDDSRGRHTTTSRQLFEIPGGGFLIDTPGMRELGVYSTEEDEAAVFGVLDELSAHCRFPNCDHEKSKGCALLEAVEAGDVEARQLRNYLKLQRERIFEESKHDEELGRQYKEKQKRLHKGYRAIQQKHRREKGF